MGRTDENIEAAIAGESLARNRYSYFAEMANGNCHSGSRITPSS